jgi:hypothetical protein
MYQDFKQDVDARLLRVDRRRNPFEKAILTRVLFCLPDDQPREALANLTHLVACTRDSELRARYIEELRALADLPEVRG